MSIFQKKVKTVTISIDSKYCIRSVPLGSVAYNATVIVEAGCVGVYVVNGRPRATFEPGRYMINDKSERKFNSNLMLIAANADKEFALCCGVGGIPYRDEALGYSAKVGVSADMKVQIKDPWALYTALGNHNVTEDEVNEYVRGQCAAALRTELTKRLQFSTYESIGTQAGKMTQKLEETLYAAFLQKGISLVAGSLVLGNIYFSEEPPAPSGRPKEIDDLEALKRVKDLFSRKVEATEKTCPVCGTAVPGDAATCPNCGRKL